MKSRALDFTIRVLRPTRLRSAVLKRSFRGSAPCFVSSQHAPLPRLSDCHLSVYCRRSTSISGPPFVAHLHLTRPQRLAPSPAFWLLCLLVPTVAVLPDFIYRCGQRLLKPLDVHIVQEVEKSELFKRDPKAWEAMAAHAQKDTGVGFSRAVDDMVAGVTKLPKRVLGLVRKKKGARKRQQPAAGASLEMPPA